MPLVHAFGKWSAAWSRHFAAALNTGRRAFHLINYLGSCGGGQVLPKTVMAASDDRTVHALQRKLSGETEENLALTMHFPTSWDPYFRDTMSVADVYHYGTQHFDHHAAAHAVVGPDARATGEQVGRPPEFACWVGSRSSRFGPISPRSASARWLWVLLGGVGAYLW